MPKQHYFEMVYDLTSCIPYGRICTYGTIADYLSLGSARMVGWALSKNIGASGIPAHRVVNRKGELTGRLHFSTPSMMQELLEAEGIIVIDHKVQDFEKLFWDPVKEL